MSKTRMPELKGDKPQTKGIGAEMVAGTMGGMAQVLVGQPFDIVKVRLQSSDAYKGALDCATKIVKQEGPLAFYKGTVMPLVGVGACVSLQFAGLGACKKFFSEQNVARGKGPDLSYPQFYLAGAGAGLTNSIVSGPVEHIRIRLQTQTKNAAGAYPYSGPFDACKKIYATDGMRGIFYGQGATLLREFHGYGLYFAAYEAIIQYRCNRDRITRKDIPALDTCLYGALAGYVLWFGMYPLDVIKSKIQTDAFPSQPEKRKFHGVVDVVRKTLATQGGGGFFKGFLPTIIRSPFANGATFMAYELTMRMIA